MLFEFGSSRRNNSLVTFFLLFALLGSNLAVANAQCIVPPPKFSFSTISFGAGGVIVGDFADPDGNADMAMISDPNFITILLGNGTGGYSTGMGRSIYVEVGADNIAVRAGDFDGDTIENDLAVLDRGVPFGGSLNLLRYNESTDQYAITNYALVTSGTIFPVGMTVAKFSTDAYSDIAVVNSTTTVRIVNVNSSGVTVSPLTITTPANVHPAFIENGDLDGDGRVDLIAGTQAGGMETSSRLTVLMNSSVGFGTGTPVNYDTDEVGLSDLTVGDVNHDGDLDVGTANSSSNSVSILLGNGSGALTLDSVIDAGSISPNPRIPDQLVMGDFNMDNLLDLATSDSSTSSISIFVGDGDAEFSSPISTSLSHTANSIAGGDLNNDGKFDLGLTTSDELVGSFLSRFNDNDALTRTDYNNDGRTDFTVWRPSNYGWYTSFSYFGTSTGSTFGASGDIPVPGDFDGDHKTDTTVFRPSNGSWYVFKSSTSSLQTYSWGTSGDIPVPGDYDEDGKTDFAVFRPSSNVWYIVNSSNNSTRSDTFGSSGDKPVQGDYDGDGMTDLAVYRPSNNTWYILQSSDSNVVGGAWGTSGDLLVPGYYDCDIKTDVAVWRASDSTWYIKKSTDGNTLTYTLGTSGDIPQPGDYDGDGKTDAAVWRPSNQTWYVVKSAGGSSSLAWGSSGDVPVSAAYIIQ